MDVRIFAPAEARLLEIWDYTAENWGEPQADKYVRGLLEAIQSCARQKRRWRRVADRTLKGIWFLRHKHHFIFFRELSGGALGVISILHESMDLPARLREDSGPA